MKSTYLDVARDALDTANDATKAIPWGGVTVLYEQATAYALVSIAESLAELAAVHGQHPVPVVHDGLKP